MTDERWLTSVITASYIDAINLDNTCRFEA
jgi:hypothetical protein